LAEERIVPVDVLTEIAIDRWREQVAAFAGDPSKAPEWYFNIRSVEWKTEPPSRSRRRKSVALWRISRSQG
jgi:hypothetical protein